MKTVTLKYQNGQFIPIGDVPLIQEGQEFVAILPDSDESPDWDAYLEMLDKTQGMWADVGDEFEESINQARQLWDAEWQKRLNSL